MASSYTREQLKISIAKICLTIGWHNTMSTPMEMLTDILYNYLYQLGKSTTEYAHQFGMTEANLEHLNLAFKDFRVNLKDFNEYLNSVECSYKDAIPKYPLPKQDNLNFLKPGSKEVISRQVHINEHLPPMFPHLEVEDVPENSIVEDTELENKLNISIQDTDPKKRPRILVGQSVRELSSVMMTTSGFLSPAIEGKLPESRTPAVALEQSVSPTEPFKTPVKIKKFSKMRREYFKQFNDHESLKRAMKIKKRKIKYRTMPTAKNYMIVSNTNKPQPQEIPNNPVQEEQPIPRNLQIPPPPLDCAPIIVKDEPYVEKLSTKPSKRKINILRKISSKNKPPKIPKFDGFRGMIGDDFLPPIPNVDLFSNFPNDLTIKPIEPFPDVEKINKPQFDLPRKHSSKTKKMDISIKMEERPRNHINEYFNFVSDSTFKYQNSNNLNIEPVNLVLPSDNPNRRKSNIIKKISNKSKSSRGHSSKPVQKNYSTDFTASIMKDVGLPHNICKDLIIEPIVTKPILEKPMRVDNYSNAPRIDTSITPKGVMESQISPLLKQEKFRDVKLKSSNQFTTSSKYDLEITHSVVPGAAVNIPQPTLPPMHFPFFNPFAGPGLIPPPLINPLYPHLPIPPLGLPAFGQLPMPTPAAPPKAPETVVSNEIPVLKPQTPKPVKVEVPEEKIPLEPEDLDIKLKKKKKKKNKKSDKKKRDKSESKRHKREAKLNLENSNLLLHTPEPPIPEIPHIPTVHIKPPKVEPSYIEQALYKREASPELAKFSALITGQPKQKHSSGSSRNSECGTPSGKRGRGRPRIHPVTQIKNEIWTCPVCYSEDNGNPMICCDGCNTWYHWVCVGIQVPPEASEDWYCRHCISNKPEHLEGETGLKYRGREKKW